MKKIIIFVILVVILVGGWLYLGNDSTVMPDLDRGFLLEDETTLSQEMVVSFRARYDQAVSAVKADSSDFNSWMDLALVMKTIGDYEGARQVWEYVGTIRPENSLSFHNLGNLYIYELEDNKRGEENLLKAIENSPRDLVYYQSLQDFYRFVLEDENKADEVMKRFESQNSIPADEDNSRINVEVEVE